MMVVDPAGVAGPNPGYLGRRRGAVSASVSSDVSAPPESLHSMLTRPGVKPSADEVALLEQSLRQHIMFSHLEEDERNLVFRAMTLQCFEAGSHIIRQGEQGSVFYVIDSGSCEIFVEKPPGTVTLVSTLKRGGSFGELALLYGSPRAASVIATSPTRLWSLDRATYHGLLACLGAQKRSQYEAFLKNIPIFSACTKIELQRIVDALQPVVYRAGDVIVRQGDPGDFFYIVVEGEVRVTKQLENGENVCVGQLGPSKYFGELALLNNQRRASTVTALTPTVRCVRVNRDGFDRVLGPCEELLRRNSQVYAEVVGVPLAAVAPVARQ